MKPLAVILGGAALTFLAALPALAAGGGPIAIDDNVVADKNVVHIDVLANDGAGGAKLDTASLRIASAPSNGEVIVIASGSPKVKYTTFGSEAAVDSFSYEICDTDGACATATVIVNFLGETIASTTTTSTPTTVSTTASPPTTASTATTASPTTTPTSPPETTGSPMTPTTTLHVTVAPASPTETTAPTVSVAPASTTTADPVPNVHALGELALGSNEIHAGTTIGEARGVKPGEDVAYLGRSGFDTVALVATPALMVSGFVGFLMIGLPRNAFGLLFGVITGRRRKKERGPKAKAPSSR